MAQIQRDAVNNQFLIILITIIIIFVHRNSVTRISGSQIFYRDCNIWINDLQSKSFRFNFDSLENTKSIYKCTVYDFQAVYDNRLCYCDALRTELLLYLKKPSSAAMRINWVMLDWLAHCSVVCFYCCIIAHT